MQESFCYGHLCSRSGLSWRNRWTWRRHDGVRRGERRTWDSREWLRASVVKRTVADTMAADLPVCASFILTAQVWLCGGSVEVVPCSRIAHIERAHKPYAPDLNPSMRRNALRVADVWLDEYKKNVLIAWNLPLQVRKGLMLELYHVMNTSGHICSGVKHLKHATPLTYYNFNNYCSPC